jgi:hypothetical protein
VDRETHGTPLGGGLAPLTAKVAGRAKLDQAMVHASPTKRNGQLGLTR